MLHILLLLGATGRFNPGLRENETFYWQFKIYPQTAKSVGAGSCDQQQNYWYSNTQHKRTSHIK